jgi:hypothetical protein
MNSAEATMIAVSRRRVCSGATPANPVASIMAAARETKVFWFFSSEKNCFLSNP